MFAVVWFEIQKHNEIMATFKSYILIFLFPASPFWMHLTMSSQPSLYSRERGFVENVDLTKTRVRPRRPGQPTS
jgi:hypothetical protein